MFDLLQIDTLQKAAAVLPAPEKISMWSLLEKGGWIMYPLYLLLVVAIFVFIERLIAIRKASRIEANFMLIIRDHIISGNVSAARSIAKNTNNPVARMIDKGLQRIGMIQLFYGIASSGQFTLNDIAGGIYVKMITSGTGLIIGLLAYIGHNVLTTMIDKTANKMEAASAEFMDILQEPTH